MARIKFEVNMNVYEAKGREYEKWEPHYVKYEQTYFATIVNGRWVRVEDCTCGSVHSYEVLDKEPGPEVRRKLISDLKDEIREHLTSRVPPAKSVSGN